MVQIAPLTVKEMIEFVRMDTAVSSSPLAGVPPIRKERKKRRKRRVEALCPGAAAAAPEHSRREQETQNKAAQDAPVPSKVGTLCATETKGEVQDPPPHPNRISKECSLERRRNRQAVRKEERERACQGQVQQHLQRKVFKALRTAGLITQRCIKFKRSIVQMSREFESIKATAPVTAATGAWTESEEDPMERPLYNSVVRPSHPAQKKNEESPTDEGMVAAKVEALQGYDAHPFSTSAFVQHILPSEVEAAQTVQAAVSTLPSPETTPSLCSDGVVSPMNWPGESRDFQSAMLGVLSPSIEEDVNINFYNIALVKVQGKKLTVGRCYGGFNLSVVSQCHPQGVVDNQRN